MEYIDLKVEAKSLEHELLALVGKDGVNQIFSKIRQTQKNQCAGCGFIPAKNQRLKLYVDNIDTVQPSNSACYALCDACHALKHFQTLVENNQIVLCNSTYSQKDIIAIQRQSNKRVMAEIKYKKILLLKRNPAELLAELKEDGVIKDTKIKIVFGKNFNWQNCK